MYLFRNKASFYGGAAGFHVLTISTFDFHENRRSEIHIFLTRVNKFLPEFSAFTDRFR